MAIFAWALFGGLVVVVAAQLIMALVIEGFLAKYLATVGVIAYSRAIHHKSLRL